MCKTYNNRLNDCSSTCMNDYAWYSVSWRFHKYVLQIRKKKSSQANPPILSQRVDESITKRIGHFASKGGMNVAYKTNLTIKQCTQTHLINLKQTTRKRVLYDLTYKYLIYDIFKLVNIFYTIIHTFYFQSKETISV